MSANARVNPTSGESTIGTTTFSRITDQCTVMPAARPTPMSAPMRACEDDDGIPSHHVMRFHTMAPMTAARTMTRPLCPDASVMSMMPLPMVWATSVPSMAPTRLNTAAMIRAARGVSARVETDVAMAFAASWKPLV
jgi:hypothetical protein